MATKSQLNVSKLAAMLRTKRGEKGLRAVAAEIGGVSASTLSRIEQGNVPDLDTFVRICRWLAVETNEFMHDPKAIARSSALAGAGDNVPDVIEAHLRADQVLPPHTIKALSEMVRLAYKAAGDGKLEKPKK